MIYDLGALDFEPDALKRLAFATQLAVAVSRGLAGGDHRPCGVLYTVDNPRGFDEPLRFCACRYPVWELRRA